MTDGVHFTTDDHEPHATHAPPITDLETWLDGQPMIITSVDVDERGGTETIVASDGERRDVVVRMIRVRARVLHHGYQTAAYTRWLDMTAHPATIQESIADVCRSAAIALEGYIAR